MPAVAEFWDRTAKTYAARPVDNPDAYEATLARVRAWLKPDMQVTELGCGTGSTALRLCDAVAGYTGTDVSGEMIRIAQDKARDQGMVNAQFVRAEAGAALARGIDVVTAFNLFHLVDDRAGLFGQTRAALPEGGLFISKTPCLARKLWLRPLVGAMQLIGKAPRPVRYFSPDRLRAEIGSAGFEILETNDFPKSLPNHFVVARAV